MISVASIIVDLFRGIYASLLGGLMSVTFSCAIYFCCL